MLHRWHHLVRVAMGCNAPLRRRDVLRGISTAGLAAGSLSWTDAVTAEAETLRRRGKACILLWMQGGPSQFETLSPKPEHANGGGTKSIATAVPGIQIAENLPELAGVMDQLAVIRSMTSKEGNHRRASFLVHTGSLPTPTVQLPTLGSLAAHEIGDADCELPSFVQIGNPRGVSQGRAAGFLGVEFDPLIVRQADRLPTNTAPTTELDRFQRRLHLRERLESEYASGPGQQLAADHAKLYQRATRMMLSRDMEAFDLEQEPSKVREAYGRTPFGNGCLLARRLIEAGVTFVEVFAGGWDTHADNFDRSTQLCERIDRPTAELIRDLSRRGRLDDTLVIWMGEFGRTPRINPRGGRDHFPRAFNVALAGGGIQGGRVIGKTNAAGTEVVDRPVSVADLFQTFCRSLQIDASKENMSPIGRPIPIVEGGSAVEELFT